MPVHVLVSTECAVAAATASNDVHWQDIVQVLARCNNGIAEIRHLIKVDLQMYDVLCTLRFVIEALLYRNPQG